jgi:hypothetical protein
MRSAVLRAVEVPELTELVTARQPTTVTTDDASPVLLALLGALGSSTSWPSRCCPATSCSASPRRAGAAGPHRPTAPVSSSCA